MLVLNLTRYSERWAPLDIVRCRSSASAAPVGLAGPKWVRSSLTNSVVSGITESWGLKLLCYLLCLQGSDTEEKESRSSVTSSPNDKQIDPALWLWPPKQRR